MKLIRIKSCRIYSLLAVIVSCIFHFSACDGDNYSSNTPAVETSKLTFNVAYHGPDPRELQTAVIDCTGYSIATVEALIYNSDGTFLVGGGPWSCEAGQGVVTSVPPGSGRAIVILGRNAEGDIVFRGEKSGINVVAGSEYNAGTIDCYAFYPTLQAPATGAEVNADNMNLVWNKVSGAIDYQVIVSENSNLSNPDIEDTTNEENYAPPALADGKTYYWQVIAQDSFENAGLESQTWSFTVNAQHVNTSPVAQITSPTNGSTFTTEDSISFAGNGNDSEDGALSGAYLVWRSDVDGQIGTDETFNYDALSAGSHQITLTATDFEGASGTANVSIVINEPPTNDSPTAQIVSPGQGSTFVIDDGIVFSGSGDDNEDGVITGSSLVWNSDVYGRIGTGETFTSDPFSAGTHKITLTATDSEGATGMHTVVITVATGRLPDTGQTASFTSTSGEDSDYRINPPAYTKLDEFGNDLDFSSVNWTMVRDDVTGLIWEVKTDDGSIQDRDNKYSYPESQDIFINQLNSAKFGSYSDWRLPTASELFNLTYTVNPQPSPTIQTAYFPQTVAGAYRVSTIYAPQTTFARLVGFNSGWVSNSSMTNKFYVRAVRGGQPAIDFVDNNDGTVTDTATGLMWQQAGDDAGRMTWEAALDYCETLVFAGYDDWRLPSTKELQSIVDYDVYNPAIDETIFPQTKWAPYWASTTDVNDSSRAWIISFIYGSTMSWEDSAKSEYHYVRAVRGGL